LVIFFKTFLKEVSFAHQYCIYLIKNTLKTVSYGPKPRRHNPILLTTFYQNLTWKKLTLSNYKSLKMNIMRWNACKIIKHQDQMASLLSFTNIF